MSSEEVHVLAKKYFGRLPAAPKPEPIMTLILLKMREKELF